MMSSLLHIKLKEIKCATTGTQIFRVLIKPSRPLGGVKTFPFLRCTLSCRSTFISAAFSEIMA